MTMLKAVAFLFLLVNSAKVASPNQDCGVRQNVNRWKRSELERNVRILKGHDAIPNSWPWQVEIYLGHGRHCGGTIISDQWILTAAHCTQNHDLKTLRINIGKHRLETHSATSYEPIKMIEHPAYDGKTYKNDIALLKLEDRVKSLEYMHPVCLSKEQKKQDFTIIGWGFLGYGPKKVPRLALQEAQVKNTPGNCKIGDFKPEKMICAHGGSDERSCTGDSGGPLMEKHSDGKWYQVGIVSHGTSECPSKAPVVYTRVSAYCDWITEITGVKCY